MIRYFPQSVKHQAVNEERQAAADRVRPKPNDTIFQAAAIRKCLCSRYVFPDRCLHPCACPVESSGVDLETVLQFDSWESMPLKHKVELMMYSGHPVMCALSPTYRCSPIHLVTTLCSWSEIKRYINGGQQDNLSLKDSMGNTAFLLLVASRYRVQLYIDKILRKMDISDARKLVQEENCEGMTALHFAVLKTNKTLIKLLLKYGASANAGTVNIHGKDYGITPFHLCLQQHSKHAQQCISLIEKKAVVNIELLAPMNPCYAVSFRFECFCGGCWSNPVKGFGAVLPKNAVGIKPSVSKGTALNILALFRDTRKNYVIDMLLNCRQDMDVNLSDDEGMTPLARAVMARDYELVELLLQKGANVNRNGIDAYGRNVESPSELAQLLVCRDDFPAAFLKRLNQLDDIVCPWCLYQDQDPLTKDNVSTLERDIRQLLLD